MSANQSDATVRVLLVDDQAMIGEVVRRMLGVESDVAYLFCDDSKAALEAARKISPTVILQDLQMPDIDGFDLLEMYGKDDVTRDVPVIMLTGKEDPASKAKAFSLGASDYLVKVPDRIELIARIRRHSDGYVNLQARRRTEEALRKAEVAARAAAAEADNANRAKSTFLANLSHEIRTPMNAILGYAQILSAGADLTQDQYDGLQTIQHSGDHLLELINDVLDISKIEAGRTELSAVDFNLIGLVRSLGAMFQQRCHAKDLHWRLEEDLPRAHVHGDENKLRQVLINLLGNAVKFATRGEVSLRVGKPAENDYLFEVCDTGPGIPEEHQTAVFEPFHQGDAGHQHGGTGLGLAIARSHVALMGGKLQLESVLGKGTTFSFTLSLASVEANDAGADDRWDRVQRLAAGHSVRALVVDDSVGGEICRRFLTRVGVEVDLVTSGSDAIAHARERHPDIVLMDHKLPDLSGAQVRHRLIQDTGEGEFPIVCATTAVLAHERRMLQEDGFEHFLDKPLRAEQLYGCLSSLLSVQYEYEESTDVTQDHSAWNRVSVTAELAAQLSGAAERQSLSELRQHIATLASLGTSEAGLASHLDKLSRRFDMEAVKDVVQSLRSTP